MVEQLEQFLFGNVLSGNDLENVATDGGVVGGGVGTLERVLGTAEGEHQLVVVEEEQLLEKGLVQVGGWGRG